MQGYLVSLLITLILLVMILLISHKHIERTGMSLGEKLISKLQGDVSNEQEF